MTTPNQFEEGHYANVDEFDALRVSELQGMIIELANDGYLTPEQAIGHYEASTHPDSVELSRRNNMPTWVSKEGTAGTIFMDANRAKKR